jgi:Flp pilus assembly protein TadG
MAMEVAVLAPALLGLLALVLSFGRFASVTGLLEAASRDGARAATQSHSLSDAQDRVTTIISDTLAGAPRSCRDSAQGEVVGGTFEPGRNVTVEVRCTVTFSDLGAWGVPGTTTVVRRFSSPLDPNQGVRGVVP